MKEHIVRETVKIPENVNVSANQNKVSVKGLLGKLDRNFSHAPVDIKCEGDEILIETVWPNKKRRAMVGTVKSHIKNMITGVTKGFTYKLKIVYAHFPMSVKAKNNEIIIENFHGERKPKSIKIRGNVKVEISGDDVIVKGMDIEEVSQTAANIQKATKIKKKDPRIFLDGIYVYERGEGT